MFAFVLFDGLLIWG